MIKNHLDILYEDNAVLVCRKPCGIPVQTVRTGQQDMVSLLRNYFAQKKESTEVFLVHRLDQPVEGVMVFARTKPAAASLSRQVRERSICKHYLAVVEGIPKPESGILEDYLLRDGRTNTSAVAAKDVANAKRAVLSYQVLETYETTSLVRIRLETGRHHQIRVQMAHYGNPLVGDKKYNPACGDGYLPIGLCSVQIAFAHPKSGERMRFEVQPEGDAFKRKQ